MQDSTTTVISSATNRSFDKIVSLADEIISLANEPGQTSDQIDETTLQIAMKDHGIHMLAEKTALLPHIESIWGQSNPETTPVTSVNGTTNNNSTNPINFESLLTKGASDLTVDNNNFTVTGGPESENKTSAAEGANLQDINSIFVSISNLAQEIRNMANQDYATNEEIDNTAHAIIMKSEGIMSLLDDIDTVNQIRAVFSATSIGSSQVQQ